MKRTLFYCLIGIGLLLPSIAAKSLVAKSCKTLSIVIEGYAFEANSDAKTGNILEVQIYDLDTQQLVLSDQFDAYKVGINLSGLPSGNYEYVVTAQYGQSENEFKL